jgi:hypothetical protein
VSATSVARLTPPGTSDEAALPEARKSLLSSSVYSTPVPQGFQIGGYVQADYLHSQASHDQLDQSGSPINENRFFLRRGRVRLDRGWDYAAVSLDLDANTIRGPIVGIRRAEASLFYQGSNARTLPPLVMVTGGLTDLPFGYEEYESDRTAPFLERSLISSALFPQKFDAGLKVTGAVSFLRYGVAVVNGEPVDPRGLPRDPNGSKDVLGRLGAVVPVGDAVELTLGSSFATGTGFHPGTPAKKSTLVWSDQNDDGTATADEISGSLGSAAQPSKNFDRWAFGLDGGVRFHTRLGETFVRGEVIAAQNYDRGYLVSDPVQTSVDIRQFGGYVALIQDITRYGYVGFRFAVYDPNADILEQRRGKIEPKTQTIRTLSPMIALRLPERARLSFQYDSIHDYSARDVRGVPADARNDTWTIRLQGEL